MRINLCRWWIIGLAVGTLSAQSATQADQVSAYPNGAIEQTCGPTDQPMLLLTLTSVPPRKHKQFSAPYIRVLLDVAPAIPRTLIFPANDSILNAQRCAVKCEAVQSGKIVIERLDRHRGMGQYDLHFTDGTEEGGTFKI